MFVCESRAARRKKDDHTRSPVAPDCCLRGDELGAARAVDRARCARIHHCKRVDANAALDERAHGALHARIA